MENSIYVGLSHQMALRTQMALIANNVANMSTPGYRGQNMVFQEYIEDPRGVEDPLSMVLDYGQYQDTRPGPMQQTGNPLDIALQGPGYIGINSPSGIMYSRAGNFQINVKGELVTGTGMTVASAGGGAPITIPKDAREISISEAGDVSTDQGVVGRIMIVEFQDQQSLEAVGNGLYKTDEAGQPAENTRAIEGMIESSNVNPVIEMTRMIDVLRSYQAAHKMLSNEHDRQRGMIQKLSEPA